MKLSDVVPWGRSLEEYRLMFELTEADLSGSILGCGDGPASFNCELHAQGRRVVSCDPIYAFSAAEIAQRVEDTYGTILAQAEENAHRYRWTRFRDTAQLGRARLGAMAAFLRDFPVGLEAGRYVPAALPELPFEDAQFELGLCSHLLFLYAEQLPLSFHLAAIAELLRVAAEVRIFPLLTLECQPSPHLVPVQQYFVARGVTTTVRRVPYEFQRGGNHMLVLRR